MSYLGIDIGTSSCKAVLFDRSGKMLANARRDYRLRHPLPGHAELDSADVIDKCCAVIAEASKGAPQDPLAAMGISCQGEAFTPVDHDGTYLDCAMVSSDSRAGGHIAPFVDMFGAGRLYHITGHTPSPLFSLFKLLWLRENNTELWKKRPRFLCFEDLLQLRLGIMEPAMGWPLAGRTMLFDVVRHAWSPEILAAADIRETQLARPLRSGSVAGVVSDLVAAELGLPRGVKVVTGGHDQTLAALGAGVLEPGEAMYAAGSVECLCPVVPRLVLNDELHRNNLCSYDYSLPDVFTSVAYSLTGSNLLQYFKENFAAETSYEELAKELPTLPSALLALPYFTPSGTPYFDSSTPGVLLGWRLSTSRGEVLKGLLEGIAMEMKLNLELLERSGIRVTRLLATGGGSRLRRIVQLKADVLNRPVETIEVGEAGCLGAARLAQSADIGIPVRELVRREPRPECLLFPDPERAASYQHKFTQYQTFYAGIRELSGKLGSIG